MLEWCFTIFSGGKCAVKEDYFWRWSFPAQCPIEYLNILFQKCDGTLRVKIMWKEMGTAVWRKNKRQARFFKGKKPAKFHSFQTHFFWMMDSPTRVFGQYVFRIFFCQKSKDRKNGFLWQFFEQSGVGIVEVERIFLRRTMRCRWIDRERGNWEKKNSRA